MGILSIFKRKKEKPEDVLQYVHQNRGVLWENISVFKDTLKGKMSVLLDTGEVKRIKAPMKVMTEIGTQRVAYMHEDCTWVCVYRTDAKNIKDAEVDVYTEDYRDLPEHIIVNKTLLCQE